MTNRDYLFRDGRRSVWRRESAEELIAGCVLALMAALALASIATFIVVVWRFTL